MFFTDQPEIRFNRMVSIILLLCGTVLVSGSGAECAQVPAGSYQEAIRLINKNALFVPPRINTAGSAASLKKTVRSIDRFSDFLTQKEYAEFVRSQKNSYVGIGAEVEKNHAGDVVLLPYPDSPAERAGIVFGDVLLAVDGQPIEGKSLFLIGAMTRGVVGTAVTIEVKRGAGKRQKIVIQRQHISTSTVSLKQQANYWLLKITRFSPSTRRNLKFALEEIDDDRPLILDLRGNPGGDINSSIDSAMLFLDEGQKIIEIHRKKEVTQYKSLNAGMGLANPVFIFQDHETASAAEVFIAALCMNRKAVSVGEKTYGKGVVQDIFKLGDGSALFLTTGYLIPPNGKKYHGKGLAADYPLVNAGTGEYIHKVTALSPPSRAVKAPQPMPVIRPSQTKNKPVSHKPKRPGRSAGKMYPKQKNQQFYLCVDKKFSDEREAREWQVEIRERKKIHSRSSVFQEYTSGTVSWLACFGPRPTKKTAEKTRELLAHKIGLPVFIRDFNTPKSPPEEIVLPNPAEPKQPFFREYYIQTGIFLSAVDAVRELEKIRSSDKSLPVKIYNSLLETLSETEMHGEDIFSNKKITVINNRAFNQRTMIHGYRVVIGPLPDNSKSFINGLKQRKIIPEDSFLLYFQPAEQLTDYSQKETKE